MFFSVLIPVYNSSKYISKCIKSVLDQTCKDFEIVAVDDGSDDDSLAVLKAFEADFPDIIKVYSMPHSGSLLTRIRCIKESSGEYLYIIDSDDYLVDNSFLEFAKSRIQESNCDLFLFDLAVSNGNTTHLNFPEDTVLDKYWLNNLYILLIKGDSLNSLYTKIISRDLVITADLCGSWVKEYSYVTNSTDLLMTIPIVFNATKVTYYNIIPYMYQYKKNDNSITTTFNECTYRSLKANLYLLNGYKYKVDLPKKELDELLSNRLMNMAASAFWKARYIKGLSIKEIYSYVRSIGEDKDFREKYHLASRGRISFKKRIIVRLIYWRRYAILTALIMFIGLFYK